MSLTMTWDRSSQSRIENEPSNHSLHLEGISRRSSTENEPNNSSRRLEDPWNNRPNVEVRKSWGPEVRKSGGLPNVEETLKECEERISEYLESQQPKKEQPEREYQDDDQDSWGSGDDFQKINSKYDYYSFYIFLYNFINICFPTVIYLASVIVLRRNNITCNVINVIQCK